MTQYAQMYRAWSKEAQGKANAIFLQGGNLTDFILASNQAEIYASKAQREEESDRREQELDQLRVSEQRRLKSLLNCL